MSVNIAIDSANAGTVYADDLRVGDRLEFGHHLVTEEELINFASLWDPQPFHTEREVAEQGQFGGLIASGLHTLAVYQRLAVTGVSGRWNVIAGRKIREARFLRPVRPNDVLTGSMVIEQVSLDDRARGLVTTSAELVDGTGETVLTVISDVFLHSRPI